MGSASSSIFRRSMIESDRRKPSRLAWASLGSFGEGRDEMLSPKPFGGMETILKVTMTFLSPSDGEGDGDGGILSRKLRRNGASERHEI